MDIGSIGYNHKHDKDFSAKMETGPGAFLFLLVKSPALFVINGKKYKVAKNSYVLLNPHTPCSYRGLNKEYVDDWFFFWMTLKEQDSLIEQGVKFDEPVSLPQIHEISSLIHKISFELFSNQKYHNEIKNLYTEIFFYELERLLSSKDNVSPEVFASKNEKITYLRTQLFQNPDRFENVNQMAVFVNLSRSGFQHLYSSIFGHSVMEDVIAGRIEKAKNYLRESQLTVSEIAVACGYKTEFHFMRQFKKMTGFTPTEFRNSDTWNQIKVK